MATIWASRRPIRDGALRSNERTCAISHFPTAPLHQGWRTLEHGLLPLTSRDVRENSNARFAPRPNGSEIIATIGPRAKEIFSPDLGR
jgi:hypothetical protein